MTDDELINDAIWLIERGTVIREDFLDDYNQRCRDFMSRWLRKDIAFPNFASRIRSLDAFAKEHEKP